MKHRLSLLIFLVLVLGGGLTIGFLTGPGGWYAGLAKPSFNPPPWVFAPVWVVLYALIALAGWRSFERDTTSWPMRLWWAQLGLNFLWPPVFFAAHWIGLAPSLPSSPCPGAGIASRRGCSCPTPPGWRSPRC
jgi:translocator protein